MAFEDRLISSNFPKVYLELISKGGNKPNSIDTEKWSRLLNIKNKIDIFVDQSENLIIYSKNNRNYKTYWACVLLYEYLQKTQRRVGNLGYFCSCFELIANSRRGMNGDKNATAFLRKITTANLLVIDDIAGLSLSNSDLIGLLSVIDVRNNAGLSTIYTATCDKISFMEELKQNMYSRIFEHGYSIELEGVYE